MNCIYCSETLNSNEHAANHAGECPVMLEDHQPDDSITVNDGNGGVLILQAVRQYKNGTKNRYKDGKIKCSKCGEYKTAEDYNISNIKRKHWKCKECLKKYRIDKKSDLIRIIGNMYNHQRHTEIPVKYTQKNLRIWLTHNKTFLNIYKDWVESDCQFGKIPAVVRIDKTQPFQIDNITVVTAREARCSNLVGRSRPVAQIAPTTGKEIARYPNANIAAQMLKINAANIHGTCKGTKKTCHGYLWRYV